MSRTCVSQPVFTKRRLFFQPCLSSLSKPIKAVQMKMEDVAPRARRVQHLGQVTSAVGTVGLNASGAHMDRVAYLI